MILNDSVFLKNVRDFYDCWRGPFTTSKWITGFYLEVFLRNSGRYVNGQRVRSVEISNIKVYPFYQRKGVLSDLIDYLDSLLEPGSVVFIENVLDEKHYPIYEQRGFVKYGELQPQSFYRVKA